MRRLILEAGHSSVKGQDPGAVVGDITEGSITYLFEEEVARRYELLGGVVVRDKKDTNLAQLLHNIKNIVTAKDVEVSFHLDAAANKTAHGHTLIVPEHASPTEILLAHAISDILIKYGSTSRGVIVPSQTPRKRLGWLEQVGIKVLVELGFLTNDIDRARIKGNLTLIASEIANAISVI